MSYFLTSMHIHPRNQKVPSRIQAFYSAMTFLLTIVLWMGFAPRQVGGEVSYIIVRGTSMIPLFYQGGLAVLREADYYQVGDIVTYQYPDVGPVIHRIVGRDGLRYIMKGDANSWLDSYQPVKEDIFGRLWFYVPDFGSVLMQLRSPGWMAFFIAVGTVMFGMTIFRTPQSQNRRSLRRKVNRLGRDFGRFLAGGQETYFVIAYFLGLVGIALGFFAFSRPVSKLVNVETPYQQLGLYTYTATTVDGIYDNNRLESGSPIYPQVTCSVELFFNYYLNAPGKLDVSGTYQLTADLRNTHGWKRTFVIQPETAFQGTTVQAKGNLNFCEIEKVIQQVQEKTGVSAQPYHLVVAPNVKVTGTLDAVRFEDKFSPELRFLVDPQEVYLIEGDSSGKTLQPSKDGILSSERLTENALPIFGFQLPIVLARWLSGISLALAALLIGWGAFVMRQVEQQDPITLVEFLSGQAPVKISSTDGMYSQSAENLIELTDVKDLVRVANNNGLPVLLCEEGSTLHFLVRDMGTVYHVTKVLDQGFAQGDEV